MFDVKKHLIKVQGGRQYLPVSARLIWFRQDHPDWGVETRLVSIDVEKQYAIFEAYIYNADGKLMAKGTKMEDVRGFGEYMEKAETGAIGRALAVCGYGTQFAPELDEVSAERFADSPRPIGGYDSQAGLGSTSYQRTAPSRNALLDSSQMDNGLSAATFPETRDSCETCGTGLKPQQLTLSQHKFGVALCPECQKKRKLAAAA